MPEAGCQIHYQGGGRLPSSCLSPHERATSNTAPPSQSHQGLADGSNDMYPAPHRSSSGPIPFGLSGGIGWATSGAPIGAADRVGTITLADPRHGGQEIGVRELKNLEKWKGSSTIVEASFHSRRPRAGPGRPRQDLRSAPARTSPALPQIEDVHATHVLYCMFPPGCGSALSVPSGRPGGRWRSHPRIECWCRVRDPYTGSGGSLSKQSALFREKTRRFGIPLP